VLQTNRSTAVAEKILEQRRGLDLADTTIDLGPMVAG
jgi:hypothetical protein